MTERSKACSARRALCRKLIRIAVIEVRSALKPTNRPVSSAGTLINFEINPFKCKRGVVEDRLKFGPWPTRNGISEFWNSRYYNRLRRAQLLDLVLDFAAGRVSGYEERSDRLAEPGKQHLSTAVPGKQRWV